MNVQPKIAIILCAGRGTRMGELSNTLPKPLLRLSTGETLLEKKLVALPSCIEKVNLVIGHKGDMIREHIGSTYMGKEVHYIEQDIVKSYGTGAALALCREHINGKSILVLMGDDIYDKNDLEKLSTYRNAVLLAHKGDEKKRAAWQVAVDGDKIVTFYETCPEEHLCTGIINTGAYTLSEDYFSIPPETGGDGEVQIPPTIVKLIKNGTVFNAVQATYWKQVTAPEDLTV